MLIAKYSSSAHELLLHLLSVHTGREPRGLPGGEPRSVVVRELQVVPDRGLVEPSPDPEGPSERPAASGELETVERGMDVGTPARCSGSRIRHDELVADRTAGDHAQQLLLGSPDPASDAGAHRTVRA